MSAEPSKFIEIDHLLNPATGKYFTRKHKPDSKFVRVKEHKSEPEPDKVVKILATCNREI